MSDHLGKVLKELHDKTIEGKIPNWELASDTTIRIVRDGIQVDIVQLSLDAQYRLKVLAANGLSAGERDFVSSSELFHEARHLFSHVKETKLEPEKVVKKFLHSIENL